MRGDLLYDHNMLNMLAGSWQIFTSDLPRGDLMKKKRFKLKMRSNSKNENEMDANMAKKRFKDGNKVLLK